MMQVIFVLNESKILHFSYDLMGKSGKKHDEFDSHAKDFLEQRCVFFLDIYVSSSNDSFM